MTKNETRQTNSYMTEQLSALSQRFEMPEMRDYLRNFVEEYITIGDSELYGGKHCGSDAEQQGAKFIYSELQKIGIKAELLPFKSTRFQFNDADICYEGQTDSIKPYACMSVPTASEGITGNLIDVGSGDKYFYEDNDVTGKIVLIETKEDFEDGTIAGVFQMLEAAKNGAAGIVLYTNEYILDENTIRATYSAYGPYIPYVTISAADAKKLKAEMSENPDFEITLTVDAEFAPNEGTSYEVIGEIEGKSDERIVYSAHLDHFFRCVQDNVTAVATLLGIAKAMKEIGYIPEKTINFVFSGSHEVGPVDTAAPDLLGPWKLLTELKPEWDGKIIADINFEYTALASNKHRGLTSYEMGGMYKDFLKYMPDEMPGLGDVAKEIDSNNYYLLTWCDACTFIMRGVPVFMNDAVSEQIYEMTSPYMGRDHSNMDNMDVYSAEAHVSNTCWFGCLGIYLDNQPVLVPDYDSRISVMELTDEEKTYLDSAEIGYAEYQKQLENFRRYGTAVKTMLAEYTGSGHVNDEKSRSINSQILKIQKLLADSTDGLTTAVPSMLTAPHKVYIDKGIKFADALKICENSGYRDAYEQVLRTIDMAGIEDKYSGELAKEMKQLVLGKNALWNDNKCRDFYIAVDVSEENLAEACRENIEAVKASLDEETDCLAKVNELLIDIILEAASSADSDKMMSWIKHFTEWPHRKTGTPEGLASAEYVRDTFENIGLDNIEIEKVRSVTMDCPEYEISIDGEHIECFFVNGANRRAETGDFKYDINNAEVVYLGKGLEEDFAGVDVSGKLVLCDVYFKLLKTSDLLTWTEGAELYDPHDRTSRPQKKYDIYTPNNWPYNYLYARENGAAGFIGILHNFMDCRYYHEDYNDIVDIDGYMDMPAVWVSREEGKALAAKVQKQPVKAELKIHTVYQEGEARIVKGELKGRTDDIIVVHSHHDAVNRGAVQDASGMSVVFALADFFSKIPESLREKTLMFVATDSHYTDYEGHVGFLKNRKHAGDNIVADFAVEHVAMEMDLDEDNNIVLTGEPEARMIYVDDRNGLVEFVKSAIEKYDLDKTVILPVRGKSGGAYTNDDVCSDAYDFNAEGIPVVSLLSAPMYLFHDSDDIDKVHKPSLDKIRNMYAYMLLKSL